MPTLILLFFCSGLLAAILLPIALMSLSGALFSSVWICHIGFQLAATVVALRFYFKELKPGPLTLCIATLFLFAIGLEATTPIVCRDALIYHLAVPKLWLAAGKMTELPWHEWSYFPMLTGLGYTGFLKLSLEFLTPYYHLSYLIVLASTTAWLVRQLISEQAAKISWLLVITIPLFMKLAAEPMVDLAAASFLVSALALTLTDTKQRYTIISGILFGFALSTKYNSILVVAWLILLSPLVGADGISFRHRILRAVQLAFIATLTFAPWALRNYLWIGNPLFPFLQNLFGSGFSTAFVGPVTPLTHRLEVYGDNWLGLLTVPLRMLFMGKDDSPANFDGVLSPLLILAAIPILREWRKDWVRFFGLFLILYLLSSLYLFHALLRYQAFSVVLMCILSSAALAQISIRSRLLTVSVLAAHIAFAAYYQFSLSSKNQTYKYLSGEITQEQFLTRRIGEYPIIRYINQTLPQNSKIYLLLTGNRYYYYSHDVRGGYFSAQPILDALNSEDPLKALPELFDQNGYTHILFHKRRFGQTLADNITINELQLWNQFEREHLRYIQQSGQFWLGEYRR